jgi:hypothetical protein
MAHSIPFDVLKEIINHFINDIIQLHSCLLVNKRWCDCVVAVLWQQPFQLLLHNQNLSHHIISTYLLCLDTKEILNLNEAFIIHSHLPMYEYPSFLRHLSYYPFVATIRNWCIKYNFNLNFSKKIFQALIHLFEKFSSLKTFELVFDPEDIILFDEKNFIFDQNFYGLLAICKELKKVCTVLIISIFFIIY